MERITRFLLLALVMMTTGQALAGEELVVNGDMEGADNSSFWTYRIDGGLDDNYVNALISNGVGKDGSRGIKFSVSPDPENSCDYKFIVKLSEPVQAGDVIRFQMDCKASQACSVGMHASGLNPGAVQFYISSESFTTSWQHLDKTVTVTESMAGSKGMQCIEFFLGEAKTAPTFYFDNVSVKKADDIIDFKDEKTKAMCVSLWDTSGDGELSYEEAEAVTDLPWFGMNQDIQSFDELQYFTGLTEIRTKAFYGFNFLTSVKLPPTVKSIGTLTFSETALEAITLPEGLESVGQAAFAMCKNLTEILFPASATSIGQSAVDPQYMQKIEVAKGNMVYDSRDNCNAVIKTEDDALIIGCANTVIPQSVKNIREKAFINCTGLKAINIPKDVETIEPAAFFGCNGLTEMTVDAENMFFTSPEGGNVIISGTTVVAGCPASILPEYGVETIGKGAFKGMDIPGIWFPVTLTTIEDGAFESCTGMTAITIPASVESIGQNAFDNIGSLTDVIVKRAPFEIKNYSFHREDAGVPVAILHVPESFGADYRSNETWASQFADIVEYGEDPSGTIIIYDPVVKAICLENWDTNHDGELGLGEAALVTNMLPLNDSRVKDLEVLEYFNGVDFYNWSNFSNCENLEKVAFPKTAYYIDSQSFFNSPKLNAIKVAEGNADYDSRDLCNAVIETKENKLIIGSGSTSIPGTVTSIGDYAFYGNVALLYMVVPTSVTNIGRTPFVGCTNMTDLTVEDGHEVFYSPEKSNAIVSKSNDELVTGYEHTVIPAGVKSIGDYAFEGCGSPTINIPDGVTTIGEGAFQNCYKLTSLHIPASVTTIGQWAFQYCSALTAITVDPANTTFDSRNGCNAIVRSSDNTLMRGCKNTIIPNTVENIADNALSGTPGLTSLTIPSSIVTIGKYALAYCPDLTKVVVRSSVPCPLDVDFDSWDAWDFNNMTLYVPKGSKEAYSNADGWSYFNNVEEYVPGDANGDDAVTITDAVAVVDDILGNPSKDFDPVGADITGDGVITITDAVGIVDVILNSDK